jgi:uncharacterized protein (TIGR03437 family)
MIRRQWLICLLAAPLASAQQAGNWTHQIPDNFPPARYAHAMAYDAAHGQVVLFGGEGLGPPVNDTWVWDGTTWTLKSPQTSPPARQGHAMVYDSVHGEVVLFGGRPGSGIAFAALNDTWVWDGTNWTQKSPANSPPARFQHAMAYDSKRGQAVLFGGGDTNFNIFNDTWLWDGENWTQESPGTSPSTRFAIAMAYDSLHDQTIMFGGLVGTELLATSLDKEANETWVWDGVNWTLKAPMVSPPGRDSHSLAYDSAHGQTVLFGGENSQLGDFNDTWTWDGANWTQQSPQTSPSAREAHAMAYDSGHGLVVLFGGIVAARLTADTWTWSGGPLAPTISAVVNGASFVGGGVVPGEIATAFGTNLTSSNGINLTSGLPLPTTFLTDSLTVNNQQAALFAVDNVNGQQQYNFQVPWEVASGSTVTISASNNSTASASITVPVLAAQPGIFNYEAGGNTYGAILHANFQLANTADPAKPSETVLIYCTGLGAVASPPADGEPGNGQTTMVTPTVTIGGTKAIVSFSGLAPGFVGLYQINVELPATAHSGNQAVVVESGGTLSNSVLLPVE